MRRAFRQGATAVAAVGGLVLTLTACTGPEPDPERAGTVVVAVSAPFLSLNGGTVEGRSPGSTLVRSLAQAGFVALDEDGTAVPDPAFGTIEKVSDAPLTVRYTIGEDATWSDGTAVTPADLLLEWAARSGQLDTVVPELDDEGEITNRDALDAGVAFAATSPALVHVEQVPVVDGATVTLTYASPVADWQTALDVGVPAHVVGAAALDIDDPAEAAAAVTTAITSADPVALRSVSAAWRTSFDATLLADDPSRAVTTGPYKISDVVPDGRVELVRNDEYTGPRPAAFDTVVVRSDLHPLDAVDALRDGEADVVAPLDTPDVLAALDEVEDAVVTTGGDSTLQLQLQVAGGGPFDPAAYGGDAAKASAVRRAFLLAVPRDTVVADTVVPLWPDAEVSDAMLPSVGPEFGEVTASAAADPDAAAELLDGAGVTTPVTVRVLTNSDDPVRHEALDALTKAAADAGFTVEPYTPDLGVAADLLGAPDAWDAALVPVTQGDLPVASIVARWRTKGATNLTGWSDPALDAVLDALGATVDPAQVPTVGQSVAQSLADAGAAISVVRTPVVVATRKADTETADRLPTVPAVPPLALGRADLTSWWDWARTPAS
ncbi:ABC transporter substrate-binding protein [Cellulomonas sp.]|uniref:ABC transporter substrate-binding protein n=1 Tax=Cellulomonas sp. TaxID=40001 RepID=UPI001B0D83BD|nr:ABC transporter substrate-binding protein [Cellulomonas sp.]MBO9553357.1 hypothetical protein [Cellulomonas sp.]